MLTHVPRATYSVRKGFSQGKPLGNALTMMMLADALAQPFEVIQTPEEQDYHDLLRGTGTLYATQHTQLAMLYSEAVCNDLGGPDVPRSLIRWAVTQTRSSAPAYAPTDSLWSYNEMYRDLMTVDTTVLNMARGFADQRPVTNNSQSATVLTAVLPFLIYDSPTPMVKAANTTHYHSNVRNAIRVLWAMYSDILTGNYESRYMGKDVSEVFGDGGRNVFDCLNLARWAFENCEGNFDDMMMRAAIHSGNTSAVASLAGSFYGLTYGVPAMYHDALRRIDLWPALQSLLLKVEAEVA